MQRSTDLAHGPAQSAAAILAATVVPQVERARALVDQNPASATYGCADRPYWYYRTLTNFPGATWQQLMLAFAALYRTAHPSNPFHRDPQVLALAGALLQWWAASQHADGSFDEWYLNERSYCPTAITGAGAALTMHLLGDELPAQARAAGITALTRASRWLDGRYNEQVMNQNLAAVVAIQGLARLTGSADWQRRAGAKLARVRADQNAEGWFPEYGGMDLGYSALALDLLAAASLLGAGALADTMARDLCECLASLQGAGFATPGRIGSRGTSHSFPHGALYFAHSDPAAAGLAQRWLAGLAHDLAPRADVVDDRYFAYFYLPQLALAFRGAVDHLLPTGRAAGAAVTDLPNAGLVVIRRDAWSVSVNRRLGGALALEASGRPPLYHLGYEAVAAGGRRYASASLEAGGVVHACVEGRTVNARAQFRAVSAGVPLRRLMIPFQLVVHVLRSSRMAAAFQALIKRRMVAPVRPLSLRLERVVRVDEHAVRITDKVIPGADLGELSTLSVAATVSMHSPSGRQERARSVALSAETSVAVAKRLSAGRTVTIEFELAPDRWSANVDGIAGQENDALGDPGQVVGPTRAPH